MTRRTRKPLSLELLEARVTPTISFGGGYGYDTGGNAAGAAVGDFNGDGKPDLVVSTAEGMDTFSNDGTGTFTALQVIGGGFGAIELADMNGDGKRDIVCSDYTGGTYRILLGNGNGTFQGAIVFAASGTVHDLRVADMNGDGKLDVVTSNGGRASVRLNDGTANILGPLVTYQPDVDAEDLTVADFNGDNMPDVALAGYSTDKVYVLLNTGNGALGAAVPYSPGGGNLQHITAGDFNNDGKLDLAAADVSNAAVRVLNGNGDGTFAVGTSFNSFSVGELVAADYDGDGNVDIAASSFTGSRVYVYPNDGTGTFGFGVQAAGGTNPSSLTAADVNADGRLDLISTDTTSPGSVTIAPNTSVSIASFTVTAVPSAVAGQGFDVTVTARTTANAVYTGYAGTVTFSSNDPQVSAASGLPANYTFTAADNGIHTFTGVTLKTAGARTITATSTAVPTATGTANVTVSAASVAKFGVNFPSTTAAGQAQSITITARDAFNNTVTGYAGTVHITISDGQATGLPGDYTFVAGDNGAHTFTGITLKTAGAQSITATDTASASVTGTANTIVTVGAIAGFSVVFPSTTAAGQAQDITVTAHDPFNNTIVGYAGTVHFTSSDGQSTAGNGLPANYTFVAGDNGAHTFTGVVLKTPGGQTITSTDTANSGVKGTANTTVSPGAVAGFAVVFPNSTTAGQGQSLRITARDAFNNTVTGYTGSVHFTSTDPQATAGSGLPADYTFVAGDNGVHTFTGVTLKTAGSKAISAIDTANASVNGTKSNINVTAAAAATVVADAGTGDAALVNTVYPSTLLALVTDAFGNPVPGVTVSFAGPSTGAGVTFVGGAAATTGADGRASVTVKANTTAGVFAVNGTAAGVASPATFDLRNLAGGPTAVTITGGDHQTATVMQPFGTALVVHVTDAFGNPLEGVPVTLPIYTDGPNASFSPGLSANTDAVGNATVTATAGSIAGPIDVPVSVPGGASATFHLTATPGAAANLTIVSGNNQSAVVGQAYAAPLVVRVTDAFGNPKSGVDISVGTAFDIPSVTVLNGSTFTTAADGTVSIRVAAQGPAGAASVPVAATSIPTTVTFSLTNLPVPTNLPGPALIGASAFAAGSGPGTEAVVRYFRQDHTEAFRLTPFPGFTGGVRTAVADVTGDGVPDLIAASGPGGVTRVNVYDGTNGTQITTFQPFEDAFTGGLYVSAADLDGDGKAEIVVSPDEGGGPRVLIYSVGNAGVSLRANFYGIDDANFRGGVRTALADFTGDGVADLVVAAGFGGGPRVSVYSGATLINGSPSRLFNDFFLFEESLRNGAFVAAGDFNGDGRADLVGGGGPGGGPRVLILDGADVMAGKAGDSRALANFFAGNPDNRGGVGVAVKNLDNDGKADLVVGDGAGAGSHVTGYTGATLAQAFSFDAFPGTTGGVFVG